MTEKQQENLDETIQALNTDLTSIKPEAATEVISTWRRTLSHSSNADLKQISDELGELKDALTAKSLDGKAIGKLLKSLGKNTTAAAKDADEDVSSKLKQLGQLLTKAGGVLG